jgi:hypothetical protein
MMADELRDEIVKINQELYSPEEPVEEETVSEEPTEEITAESTEEEPVSEELTEEEIQYFNELPDALGMDAEQFYNLKLKGTNGKEYSWSEVKDKLQTIEDAEAEIARTKNQLEQQQEEFTSKATQFQQQQQPLTQEVQQAQNFLGQLEQAYQVKYQALEAAKQANDTEAMAHLNTELLEVQTEWTKAKQYHDSALQKQQQLQHQALAEHRTVQQKKLASYVPEFADPEKGPQLKGELTTYLTTQSLMPQEIGSIIDARVVNLFYKAMQWDKHQSNVKKTTAKVRDNTVRRLVKGKHSSVSDTAQKQKKVIDRGKASNREADKRAAYMAVAQQAGLLEKRN